MKWNHRDYHFNFMQREYFNFFHIFFFTVHPISIEQLSSIVVRKSELKTKRNLENRKRKESHFESSWKNRHEWSFKKQLFFKEELNRKNSINTVTYRCNNMLLFILEILWNTMINLKGYIFAIVIVLMQTLFAFLFGFHSEYKYSPITSLTSLNEPDRGNLEFYYPFFMDIHVMMFVGFGFLMTFLRRYSFSSVGFNFLLCAICLEWGLIIQGYLFDWDTGKQRFFIDMYSLIGSDFTSASILISMGAVLGKGNLLQLVLMAFFEVPIQIVNKYISTKIFCASDAGESMYVHMFGMFLLNQVYRTNRIQLCINQRSSFYFRCSFRSCCEFCFVSTKRLKFKIRIFPLYVWHNSHDRHSFPILFLAIIQLCQYYESLSYSSCR